VTSSYSHGFPLCQEKAAGGSAFEVKKAAEDEATIFTETPTTWDLNFRSIRIYLLWKQRAFTRLLMPNDDECGKLVKLLL
jgi:hypothetical protein